MNITWSIRGRQLLLLLTILLPALGIVVVNGLRERRHLIEDARSQALLLTQSLAAQQEQMTASTREMLETLAQLPAVQQLDAPACNELFLDMSRRSPRYSTIGLVTLDGSLLAASAPFDVGTINLADRKHIRDAIRTLDFSAGEYIVGRLSKVPSLNYTYPVLDAQRRLVAVVAAGVKLDEVARFLSQVKLPEDCAVGLIDHRGVRLLRLPENETTALGKPIPAEVLERVSGPDEQGIFEHTSEDGTQRFYGFKRLCLKKEAHPYLYLFVGMPKARVLRNANARMLNNLLILSLAALLAAALSWVFGTVLVARPLQRLVSTSQHLGKGEVNSRTGLPHTPDEFGRLARAFDEMATLLELREQERDQAEEALHESCAQLEKRVMERTAELSAANAALKVQIEERKLAEEELLFRNIQLAAQQEASLDGILILDERNHIISYNHRLIEMWKIPASRMGDRSDAPLLPFLATRLAAPQPFESQYPCRQERETHQEELFLADGRIFDSYSAPLIGPEGRFHGRIWYFRDTTEHRHGMDALREREEKYRAIFDESVTTIYVFDTRKHFIDTNQAGLDLLGYSREELLRMSIPDVDADPVVVLPIHQELLSGGRIINYEHRLRRKDGTVITVLNNSRALSDHNGNVVGMVSTLLDITERKRAEDDLRRTTTLIDMIIENIPNMIFVKDAEDLRFVRFNKAGEQLLGYSRKDLLGKNDYDFFPKEQAEFFTQKDREVLGGRDVVDIPEELLETANRGTRILHTKKVPLLGADGAPEYLLGISEDITDRKMAEEALHRSLEEKISLLKEVHHRVKNNLQVVISLLNLQIRRSESPEVVDVLQDMGNRIHSMALLHEILYRSDNLARINLTDYVEELCAQLLRSSRADTGRVELETSIADIHLPLDEAVPYALIINELVSNALKHGFPDGRGGQITVSTRLSENDQIHLSVTDNGIGLAPYDVPTERTTLGLQLVSRLARQLGGSLQFHRGKDSGVSFHVAFPVPEECHDGV